MQQNLFELIDHTADVGIRAYGPDLPQLFAHAALGMFSLVADLEKVRDSTPLEVRLDEDDVEELFHAWLAELLYHFEVDQIILSRFEVHEASETTITATCWGEPIDLTRHTIRTQIKSVTYHELKVLYSTDGYTAEVLFDI